MATSAAQKRQTFAPQMSAMGSKKQKGPNIGYVRSEIALLAPKWNKINDCLIGEDQIKAKGDLYLIRPNAADTSRENLARFDSYLGRAVFYNVTRHTMDGLLGQVFSRDPLIRLPEIMKPMINDVDGSGVSLDQQAKKGLALCLGNSGFGILVDYPVISEPISLAEQRAGYIRPTLIQYARSNIINWRFIKRGAKQVLSLVVTAENNSVKDDGFEVTVENQWRVMELDAEGHYVVTIYRYDPESEDYVLVSGPMKPTDASGKPLEEIPFYFAGAMNNDAVPDEPPLYDLAALNLAHYRNSADYEDSCFMVGQPTPVFAGITDQWYNKVFKNKVIELGARAAVALPVGGSAMLLQADSNSMPMEAMKQKEAQMIALGAKLVEPGGGANTLGQAQMNETSESSMLSTAAKNVSMCYSMALQKAAERMYGLKDEVEYSLNTDFPGSRLTPNERTQLVMEWQSGAITVDEMRAGLRKAGVATLDMEAYKAEIAANPPLAQQQLDQAKKDAEMTNNQGKGGADNDPKRNKDENNNGGNQNKI